MAKIKTKIEKDQRQNASYESLSKERAAPSSQISSSSSNLSKLMKEAVHPEDHIPYTPFQEALNCVSMCLPSILCAWYIHKSTNNYEGIQWSTWVLMFGTFVHLPFSVLYHGVCALGHDSEDLKRTDLSFIHITSCIYSYALSASPLYLAANIMVNARHIAAIWAKTGRHKAERSKNILFSVTLYLMPILFGGDTHNFIGTVAFFLAGGLCFQINLLGGYGHSIFHTIFIGFQYYLLQAAQHVGRNGTVACL